VDNTPLTDLEKEFAYWQDKKLKTEELLKIHRENLHRAEKKIALQGGAAHADPGVYSDKEREQQKVDQLKRELAEDTRRIVAVQKASKSSPSIDSIPIEPPIALETTESKWLLKVIIISVICLFIIGLDVLLWSFLQTNISIDELLDNQFHHLGDNIYNEEYIKSIRGDRIRNLEPEGIVYSTLFNLEDIRRDANIPMDTAIKQAELYMSVNHVKPRHNSPVVVSLNNSLQGLINDYVEKEEFRRRQIVIPLRVNDFLERDNEVVVQVRPDTVEGDFEDMEFDNLGIRIEFNEARVNTMIFVPIITGEILLIAIFGFFLARFSW
jgi:hypothetical protein